MHNSVFDTFCTPFAVSASASASGITTSRFTSGVQYILGSFCCFPSFPYDRCTKSHKDVSVQHYGRSFAETIGIDQNKLPFSEQGAIDTSAVNPS